MRNNIVVVFCLLSTLCKGQTLNKFRKYINNNTEIASIIYPSEWIAKEHSGMELVFLRPQMSTADTVFRENFNLTIGGTMGYNTIEAYAEALPEKLKGYIESFVRQSFEVTTIGNLKCAKTIYNYIKDGFEVKVALYQYMLHGQVYSITCTTTKDNYKNYATTFDKIGNSFEVR